MTNEELRLILAAESIAASLETIATSLQTISRHIDPPVPEDSLT